MTHFRWHIAAGNAISRANVAPKMYVAGKLNALKDVDILHSKSNVNMVTKLPIKAMVNLLFHRDLENICFDQSVVIFVRLLSVGNSDKSCDCKINEL